jgi:hypothetical protein
VYVREVTGSPGRAGLHAKIDRLSYGEAEVVGDFLDAMLMPVYSEPLPRTWLTTPAWTDSFMARHVRRQSDRRDNIVRLFQEYQRSTSAIMMLRGFRARDGYGVLYELLEIPTTVFGPVSRLTVEQAQAGTIKIPPAPEQARFSIRVDRSDAKITVTGIDIGICIVHGRWGLGQADQPQGHGSAD